MKASRRLYMIAATLAAVTFAVSSLSTILAHAQSADAAAVEQAGETLRKLMINPTSPRLSKFLPTRSVTSDGRVQTKAEFVDALVDGKSMFKSISLTGQTVSIVGDIAILRHRFEADAVSNGTPSRPRIKILQVWQKQDGRLVPPSWEKRMFAPLSTRSLTQKSGYRRQTKTVGN
jgi:Domain of unknown function (DUF4440)